MNYLLLSSIFMSVLSSVSFANTTVNSPPLMGTSQFNTTTSSEQHSILDRFYLNYFANYHGSRLSNLGDSRTLNNKGNPSPMGIYFDSDVTAAYMIDSANGIGPDIPFLLVPVLGQGFIMGDAGVRYFNRNTIKKNGFILNTNLILQAPSSLASQNRHMVLGVKSTPSIFYTPPGSRWTFGAWTEIKAYLGATSDKTFKLYGAPYVSYRLLPQLAVNLGYEIEAHHDAGYPAFNFFVYQSDFEPGLIWYVTPRILINPYVQFFTNNKINLDTTALGAVISLTML